MDFISAAIHAGVTATEGQRPQPVVLGPSPFAVAERRRAERDAMLADHVLDADSAGLVAQRAALRAALRQVCPEHPLLQPTGDVYNDGTAQVGDQLAYDLAFDRTLRERGVADPESHRRHIDIGAKQRAEALAALQRQAEAQRVRDAAAARQRQEAAEKRLKLHRITLEKDRRAAEEARRKSAAADEERRRSGGMIGRFLYGDTPPPPPPPTTPGSGLQAFLRAVDEAKKTA